jgi:polyhydroxyalkanoate synthase
MLNPMFDPAQLLASLLKGGQDQAEGAEVEAASRASAAPAGAAVPDPAAALAALAQQVGALQQQFFAQMTAFWTGPPAAAASAPKVTDKRFAGEAWRNDPRFDMLARGYLAYSEMLAGTVDAIPLDAETKARMRFGMRQLVDAMSPSNFFLTNPEAMQLAAETGGQSVVRGMNLFYEDLAKGRISTTDEKAYEVGRNIATMPGEVIYENELMQLIQYAPATKEVHEIPIVMIPPCINKFYIMDLQPDNSLVRYLREEGHTVFMLSWRNVQSEHGHFTWDDYVEQGALKAIDAALEVTGAPQANTLGFCIGGTILGSALAVMKARGGDQVASLTLLTSMLDFRDTGEIGTMVTEQSIAAREASIGGGGIMQGKELSFTFSSLRANDLMWQYVSNSYLKGRAPPAFDMLYWNGDNTNLPGPMFCWYVRNCYLENKLRIPGETQVCGEALDLTLIDVPAFVYASREDHIVPWQSAYASNELLAGETTFVLGASGHIAGVINPPAKNKRNHWVGGTEGPDAGRWLETARNVPGSWWPEWGRWLARQAGERVPARTTVGNRKYRPIEAAPGRYVKEPA